MLHRHEPDGLVVISQPAHAWLTGQLARAWGNEVFGAVEPWEEVCLAAEQHDLGWTAWEIEPTLNAATGRPHAFTEMPLAAHLAIWSAAGPLALTQGRYAALLISLHGAGLYQRRDLSQDSPADAAAVHAFLARAAAFQETVLRSLQADPLYAPWATPAAITRNRGLLALWDRLSLALCMGQRATRQFAAPTPGGETPLTLVPDAEQTTRVTVIPWPFRVERVTLIVEGRRLVATFPDEAAMRAALAGAPWVTLAIHLHPA